MSDDDTRAQPRSLRPLGDYEPPTITYLGDLADLTRQTKGVGGADGMTVFGVDVGS